MSGFESSPDERLDAFLSGGPWSPVSRLAGDASTRLYYRIGLAEGRTRTRIVALMPEPFDASDMAFLDAQALFRELSVRAPHVFDVVGAKGLLVLEDLGDRLLQDEVRIHPGEKHPHYVRAVNILGRLQLGARELNQASHRALRTAFDQGKFYDELVFFRVHFLEALRGQDLDPEDARALDGLFEAIAGELASQPFALCHRDYHARNLIVIEDELAVIDFQDARMGPRVYDLVSLLSDSYVAHPPELIAEMRERFSLEVGADVSDEYDLAALQRNLKALGTFGYQIVERHNEVYRPYLGHTLALVRDNLARNPRFATLRRLLSKFLPELT